VIARDAVGVGLRPPHFQAALEATQEVDFLELVSENFLDPAGAPRRYLDSVKRHFPIVLHGVGLNLLGHAPLDERYLDALRELADFVDAPYVTDHLCWTAAHGMTHHDLLPMPYTEGLVEFAAERAAFVQERLGRPFGLENVSSYIEFTTSTLTESEFYTRVVKEASCWFMFDINNVFVSAHNHGYDPELYLDAIDFERVLQVHLAGHELTAAHGIIDTHDRAVDSAVWSLYKKAWQKGGPFPTLLEWDDKLPAFSVLTDEANKAKLIRV